MTRPPLAPRQVAFLVAALLVAVMSFELNATMLAPAIRDIETQLGDGAFAAMSTYFYLAGASATLSWCGGATSSAANG